MVKFQGTTLPQKLSPEEMQKAVLDLLSKINTTFDSASGAGDLASTILAGLSSFPSPYQGSMFSYGTNSNGSYLKFANGTMICWGSVSISAPSTVNNSIGSYGWSYYEGSSAITFPASFSSLSYRFAGVVGSTNDGFIRVDSRLTTGLTITMIANNGFSTSCEWIVIGQYQ